MVPATMHPYIVKTPGTCGGRPRIDGHRIRVQDISTSYTRLGMSADEICDAYPSITLAQVHAALAYYFDHREEVEAEIAQDARFVEEFIKQNPGNVIDLRDK